MGTGLSLAAAVALPVAGGVAGECTIALDGHELLLGWDPGRGRCFVVLIYNHICLLGTHLAECFLEPGAIFTRKSVKTWYKTLKKPSWTPPNWLFGPGKLVHSAGNTYILTFY